MKIKSVYIASFGGIKDLCLDLNDGFNLIYGPNEQGKSTVMAFIKMMFYGSDRGSSKISKNLRKKYTPWDGSPMGGSIDFEFSGKNYRLERQFRSSNSTDKLNLIDLDFGEHQTVSGDIGNKFFGISAAAFDRSFFIGQSLFPESDSAAEGEINSKLSNLAMTGDEDISYEKVHSRLEKAKLNLMSKSGRTGEYDKNLKLCAALKERIEKAQSKEAELASMKTKISALQEENAKLSEKAATLKTAIDSEQDIRNRQKMEEYLRLKNELDSLNGNLRLKDGSLIDEMFLRKLQFCISKVQSAESRADAKLQEKERLEKSIESALNPPKDATEETAAQLEKDIQSIEEQKEKYNAAILGLKIGLKECEKQLENKKPSKAKRFLIAGIILILACVVTAVMKLYIPAVTLGVLGIASLFGFYVSSKTSKLIEENLAKAPALTLEKISEFEAQLNSAETELSAKKIRLEAIRSALNATASILLNQREMLKEAEAELLQIKKSADEEKSALFAIFGNYKETADFGEILNSIDEISAFTEKQKELKQHLTIISRDLNGISYEEAAQKLDEMKNQNAELCENFEDLKKEYEEITAKISGNKSEMAAISAEAKILLSQTENADSLKSEFKSLMQKTVKQKEFCTATDVAMEVLTESFAEIRKSYGSVLEKTAGEIFSCLSGGKYSSMSISNSFDINVTEKDVFGSRQVDYLSGGGADQAYLSLRLAIAQLISGEKDALPIFLDDALTQYDDRRAKAAMEFLKNFSKTHQTVMFTCHDSICQIGKAIEVEPKTLR